MLHLTEISIRTREAVDAAMALDPLIAGDLGYCLKTWMADKPGLACRPWRATTLRDGTRITGWRREPPQAGCSAIYAGSREFAIRPGQSLTFSARVLARRRNPRRVSDAAEGRADPRAAYEAWLWERLVDVMPFARIDAVLIEGFRSQRVLRKVSRTTGRTRVREECNPVVDATVCLTAHDPERVEDFLLVGLGPQKCFGYGAFIPIPDPGAS
jgi:hypothetical protein